MNKAHLVKPASRYQNSKQLLVLNANKQTGFTLVELMVVVVILSIFAGMMTLSVGSTESRKNRAFYEHLIDSLSYVRLVSAERMQPMGLMLQPDNQGQVQPVIMSLDNPYAHFESQSALSLSAGDRPKNSMELSGMNTDTQVAQPSWHKEASIVLPSLPANVDIQITSLDTLSVNQNSSPSFQSSAFNAQSNTTQQLQPWFSGIDVPQALWFGTGEAAPARIEVTHNNRLVGDAIILLPDGRVVVGE